MFDRWWRDLTTAALIVGLGVVIALASSLHAADAFPGGQTGHSGIDGASTCAVCHAGADGAVVAITGPASVEAGRSASYTVSVSGGPAVVAGFNLATERGVLGAGDGSTVIVGDEATHATPVEFAGGSAVFTVTLLAPDQPGPLRMFAAGVSANGADGNRGDATAASVLNVEVTEPVLLLVPTPAPVATEAAGTGGDLAVPAAVADAERTAPAGVHGFGLDPRAGADAAASAVRTTSELDPRVLAVTGRPPALPTLGVTLIVVGASALVAARRNRR